jgi:hypothetical protein
MQGLVLSCNCTPLISPPFLWLRLSPDVDMGERVEESKNIQQPKHYGDDHHCIQDGFDRSLHWYEAVDQPEQKSDHDQNDEYLK